MIQWSKVWSDLFIILALTSNVGFLVSNDPYQLIIAIGVNLIATVLKFNIKKFLAAELLATAFIADLHLIPTAILYFSGSTSTLVTGLAVGAAVANLISVILIIIDIIMSYKYQDEY
ncbi:MAG: DUF6394 family protein [Deferribacterales bacterium]|jgi:hypothetical protein